MKSLPISLLLISTAALASCGGGTTASGGSGGAPGAGGRGSMPPMPVEMVTLESKPVEQASEFVGTVKSRRSTDIQPQAEGFITRIMVKSGAHVGRGTPLMQIYSRVQQANIAGLDALRAQREADLAYAQQENQRAQKLLAAGAGSQMDADRAAQNVKTAQAQLQAINEQIRGARTDLGYYTVTAPTAGVIGDIPVREGDRVTKTTALTSIDSSEGLEVYLNIPVQDAPKLRMGLPVRLVDENGQTIAEEKINFIAPSVDTTTQTVLAKTPVTVAGALRPDQFVRAQVIWTSEPGVTVPVTAVTRINGQWFCYVAEPGEGGKLIAHQRALQLGRMLGNDYVVISGLKPGDKLITGGIQKIGDGSPVLQGPPSPGPSRGQQ